MSDSFSYIVTDKYNRSATGTVTVNNLSLARLSLNLTGGTAAELKADGCNIVSDDGQINFQENKMNFDYSNCETVRFTVTEGTKFKFSRWTSPVSHSNHPLDVNLYNSVNLIAEFETEYRLVVSEVYKISNTQAQRWAYNPVYPYYYTWWTSSNNGIDTRIDKFVSDPFRLSTASSVIVSAFPGAGNAWPGRPVQPYIFRGWMSRGTVLIANNSVSLGAILANDYYKNYINHSTKLINYESFTYPWFIVPNY